MIRAEERPGPVAGVVVIDPTAIVPFGVHSTSAIATCSSGHVRSSRCK